VSKCPICDFDISSNLSVCPGCSSRLIKCRNCGNLVFYKADKCPNCGEDPKRAKSKEDLSIDEKQRGLQKLYDEGVRIKTGAPSIQTIRSSSNLSYIPVTPEKSFTGKAILTLVLYYIGFWIGGFIANLIFLNESKREARRLGRSPDGAGCLGILWFFHVTLPIIAIIILMIISAITGLSIFGFISEIF
jgi:hypothetical protein